MTGNGAIQLSVIIPCRNERGRIHHVLQDLADQDYTGRFEVIVADGESHDGTWQQLLQYQRQASYPYGLVLVRNPARHIPHALNLTVKRARGELIVRLDAHATVERQYLSKMVRSLQTQGIDLAGPQVRWVPGRETLLARVIAAVLNSKAGNGGNSSRNRLRQPTKTEHAVMSCYPRQIWQDLGGYDEKFLSNEDFEFDYRAYRRGYGVYSLPEPNFGLLARSTLSQLGQQRWRYGFWKAQVLKKHPRSLKLRQVLPMLLWPLVIALALQPILLLGFLALYPVVAAATVFGNSRELAGLSLLRRLTCWSLAAVVLLIVHFVWSAGLWYGLAVPPPARRRHGPVRLHPPKS